MRTSPCIALSLALVLLASRDASAQVSDWGALRATAEENRGYNVALVISVGMPFTNIDAPARQSESDDAGLVPGYGLRVGYDWLRWGVQGGLEVTTGNALENQGIGVGIVALLRRRIGSSRFAPSVGVGIVHQLILPGTGETYSPWEEIDGPFTGPTYNVGGESRAATGVRLQAGGELPFADERFAVVAHGTADLLPFRAGAVDGVTDSPAGGFGIWPRLNVGIRMYP